MKIPIAFAAVVAWSVTVRAAVPGQNIQSRPTATMYETANSSFDNMVAYRGGQKLNGLGRSAPAFLIARFSGVYIDRGNFFGDLAWDTMAGYSNGNPLNGLNLGFGYWPALGTAYVDRGNYLGILAFDTMASYSNGNALNGLNGGQGWNGPYVDRGNPVIITAVHCGGCGSACNILFTGYPAANQVYFTTDGTIPNPSGSICNGGTCLDSCSGVYSATTTGTWTFRNNTCVVGGTGLQQEMAINAGTVINAVGTSDGVNFSAVSTFTYISCP